MHAEIFYNVEIDDDDYFKTAKDVVYYSMISIYERSKRLGYLYLEDIYSALCIDHEWNPYDVNQCWIRERNGKLKILIGYDRRNCRIIIRLNSER